MELLEGENDVLATNVILHLQKATNKRWLSPSFVFYAVTFRFALIARQM